MLNSVKSFAITFCAATLIFGLIAWFVVGMVSKTLGIEPADTTDTQSGYMSEDIGSDPNTSTADKPQTGIPDITGTGSNSNTVISAIDPEEIKGESFTMLLIGTDYFPDDFKDYADSEEYLEYLNTSGDNGAFVIKPRKISTDSIVLLRFDKERAEIMISPLPSDLKVQAAGVYTLLGNIYAAKGAEYLCGIVTAYTGLTIDYYASVAPKGFADVIDEFGGITFNVPQDMEYTDESQQLEINLKRGTTKLDGKTALSMLRYIGYTDGNVSRMKLAVDFLKTFISVATADGMLEKIPAIYPKLADAVTTNFSLAELNDRLDLIFAYKELTPVTLMYPVTKGTLDGEEVYEPSYTQALSQYKAYKIQ